MTRHFQKNELSNIPGGRTVCVRYLTRCESNGQNAGDVTRHPDVKHTVNYIRDIKRKYAAEGVKVECWVEK